MWNPEVICNMSVNECALESVFVDQAGRKDHLAQENCHQSPEDLIIAALAWQHNIC